MKHTPLVSVIIPNYCHSKYLDERISSILNQTYQNYEIIILDDCSPDEGASIGVIEKYRDNPKVSHIVYNELNSGSTFKQWYLGISLAKGNLLWIAESDDSCSPVLLETLVNEFEKYPDTVYAYSTSCLVDQDSNIYMRPIDRKNKHLDGVDYIKKYLVQGNSVQNASSCLFRKDVVSTIDQEYTKYKGAGDWLFWLLLAEKGEVSIVNKGLNYFRKHNNNTTAQCYSNGKNFKENKIIFDIIERKGYYNFSTRCLTKWFNYKSIKKTRFVNEDIHNEVYNLWNFNSYEVFWGDMYYKLRFCTRQIQFMKELILHLTSK